MRADQAPGKKDLIVLVADENQRSAAEALLKGRFRSLRIRAVSFDIFVHHHRDPGVLNEAHLFLSPLLRQYEYAMVWFDREGCGRPESAHVLQEEVQGRLNQTGWEGRSAVIVLDPELEVWVWSGSPHVSRVLTIAEGELQRLLSSKYRSSPYDKPNRPKEAMLDALHQSNTPRSSSIYKQLAEKVSLSRCGDASFHRLRETLRRWFPAA